VTDDYLAALPATVAAAAGWLQVNRPIPRAEAVRREAAVLDDVQAAARRLLPIYQFIAWSRDNDFVSMREQMRQEKQTQKRRGLCRHDQVRIVRGVFAGKSGVVQELDGKGSAKILVGKLAVKVEVSDLTKD
jgi:transcription antitermination factor NusG